MVVAFHGGAAHGIDLNLPEPLPIVYHYPVPMTRQERLQFPPPQQEIVDYYLIPGLGYFHPTHPKWKDYQQYCNEVTHLAAIKAKRGDS